ncbi:DNA repair protein RecO [candidate division WWE3 bacterium RIFOXYC2_FULL_42_13]|uniref:DNA repair protein RecO n=1 Tax=candidate division WWE3 bacterium TaxID=2053526 RepID=A0A3D0ZRS2_UNCKA|nr:MAG: DNA repair protein RecO [candidate division WWE3 bacterium RIFOXYA2_FULL_43_12]OGC66732.1 MAG: DNA repair protein RecO [candidate division WWE3 bacterium RIFOXYA12_FULL_43_11]OGC74021.1 MAG: DNA repair protein RecO [candidate division WWE3 bacterium RIFOXYB2_FULL_43_9]OGC74181.1 MAG: DNA repair protein RecO [candidate division WWE3 bacterium RIFOXYC2_FULL_42_13]OGC75442.1 MAG: DNA repair protein RecO [candidate division WWE3 bacterium RIFOXYD2_FULL_43_10]HBY10109.1 DNA repair protein R
MKKVNTVAVVLKSINYRDSDKIYTLLSKDLGKIPAIARGVRKISSRRAGNLDTLNLVKVGLSEGLGGMRQIDEVSGLNSFKKLKGDYALSIRCSYVVELLHKTTEESGNAEEAFELLVKFLKIASRFPENIDLAVRFFEIHYLGLMGYGLNTETCLRCKKELVRKGPLLYLAPDRGGFFCDDCSRSGLGFPTQTVGKLRELSQNKLTKTDEKTLKDLSTITSALIDEHFGIRIKSRELL